MQRLFSIFPAGWPSAGLVLMRLAVAFSAISQGSGAIGAPHAPVPGWAIGLFEIGLGAATLIGFLTPITGALAALANLATAFSSLEASGGTGQEKAFASIYLAVMSIALALLGPGAFSIDARLFGRREIIIPTAALPPSP